MLIIDSSRLNLLGKVIELATLSEAFTKAGFKSTEKPPKKEEPKQNYSSQQKKSSPTQKISTSRPATAPYNFVALPKEVLPAQFENLEDFKEHIKSAGNISGEILLNIETLTPLFIGGNGTKSFAPIDTPIIPGSTLRGMFKNIFKIVTCGAFRGQTDNQTKGEDFNDEHIYFRCLMATKSSPAWMSSLNKLYNSRMTHVGKDKSRIVKNARPGFLICTTDNKYFIAPSIVDGKPMYHDHNSDKILIREYEEKFRYGKPVPERNSSCVEWHDTKAYIITGSQSGRLYTKEEFENLPRDKVLKVGKQFIRYTKLEYVDWSREHWIALPDEIRTSYEHDRNRRGVNPLKDAGILERKEIERLTGKNLSDVKTLIPCHFLEEGGQVTAFGHGLCFRIPYQKRIGDAVPKDLQSAAIDFADAVFGRAELWASRVYFEDATPENFSELPTAKAHPLMQPNPTSYQLYLKQNQSELNHWDAVNAQIRGYKLYWHNAKPDWRANDNELKLDRDKTPDKRLTKEITPLSKGSKFKSKIRFKNLSAVELGALMMIFDLDDLKTAAYKIGQGKPLGFGSVKITPKLFIEDDTAYTELFDADGWKNPCREENPAAYIDSFKKYVAEKNMSETWKNVIDELKKILDWSLAKQTDWSERIKSMSGDVSQADSVDERFKKRAPLPTIFEVVK